EFSDEATRPTEIKRLGPEGLQVTWLDGHRSLFPLKYLRLACECATCVDEWTREKLLRPEEIPDDLAITAIELVGRFGIQLAWSNGHSTGIYGYEYLRRICPCPECEQVRSSQQSG